MIGCGSNSKLDPIPPIPTNGYLLTNVTSPFVIGFAGQEKDFQVQLLKDGLPVSGETVMTVSLPAKYGFLAETSVATNAGGYAVFHYTAADPLIDGPYQLALIHDDEDEVRTVAYLDINIEKGSLPFDYKFINATSPIYISRSKQEEYIHIELVDKDNDPVSDKTLTITSPETGYGSIDPRITTSSSFFGEARFKYTAPQDLRGLSSTTVTISFEEHGNAITQDIEIVFRAPEYRFQNPSTPILINQAGQQEQISVYLMDENNKVVGGKLVTITPLESRYGSVDPLQTHTAADTGKATFNYTAPDDITGLGSTTVTLSFMDEFDHTITQNIEIRFQ